MKRIIAAGLAVAVGLGITVWLVAASLEKGEEQIELLNVSYDPTRELWRELNREFVPRYQKESGKRVVIRQSHGGSSSQSPRCHRRIGGRCRHARPQLRHGRHPKEGPYCG